MAVIALMLAGALACGPEVAADQRPVLASRADAIIKAARQDAADAPPPTASTARYPSADGDILAGLGRAMAVPPLAPLRPATAPRAPSASSGAVDSSGLLGGPRQ